MKPLHCTRTITTMRGLFAVALLLSTIGSSALAQDQLQRDLDVPYVPTRPAVVDKMLDIANVSKDDMLFDLGSGDGRIVITAAKERGARGVGVDLNPQRIAEARANAKKAGVEDKVKFVVGDLFKTDFSEADVVTLYLLPHINVKLRPQLWEQLAVGSRVVSHDFDMGPEWPPERTEQVEGKTVYLWTITPENKKAVKVAGNRAQ